MPLESNTKSPLNSWSGLFVFTTIISFVYIFMEWLFIITKPSSLSALPFSKKIEALLFLSSFLTVLCFLVLFVLLILDLIPGIRNSHELLINLGAFLPAIILASLLLMMVDNFTYTMFHYGIVSSQGIGRGLYALGYLIVLGYVYWRIKKTLPKISRFLNRNNFEKTALIILTGLIIISFLIPICSNDLNIGTGENKTTQALKKHPHIIIITADGLNAASMSVYGYERDTTPRIRELAETSLVAENAFTNSGSTPGSIVSLFTGKYPATAHVLYPPDILQGENAYQHLPGILREQGYYSVQMSIPKFGDAYTLNFISAFDEANGRRIEEVITQLEFIYRYIPSDFAYFLNEITYRLLDRLKHIFYLKTMINPYTLVMKPPDKIEDQLKIDHTIELIQKSNQPLMVHIHLMGTHGPNFNPSIQTFSKGKDIDTQVSWDADFYDDSILVFDGQIGEIIDELKKQGMYENSIIIISSDHGQHWKTYYRIPLIIHFPNGQFKERIKINVQTIDIAPTILDYLGIKIPGWMQGKSLLENGLTQRPIIGVKSNTEDNVADNISIKQGSNFDNYGRISVVYCQKWYLLNLIKFKWESGEVEDHTAPCQATELITDEEAFLLMRNHLTENGFDVSSLDKRYKINKSSR